MSLVIFVEESDPDLWGLALTSLTSLIRASTTSMTSVPKPLKFMIPHFDKMKEAYAKMPEGPIKVEFRFQNDLWKFFFFTKCKYIYKLI